MGAAAPLAVSVGRYAEPVGSLCINFGSIKLVITGLRGFLNIGKKMLVPVTANDCILA